MECSLVFPHQLFRANPCLHPSRPVYVIEEWLFFKQYCFHRQKLVLHRASMQYYAALLRKQGYTVHYIESNAADSDIRQWLGQQPGSLCIHVTDVHDDWLQQRLETVQQNGGSLVWYRTPAFLNSVAEGAAFFEGRSFFQTDFYKQQRKNRKLLMEGSKPMGGQWTFDADNRQRLPDAVSIPALELPSANAFVKEARAYVQANFASNYGSTGAPFTDGSEDSFYPVTHEEAEQWLRHFLESRFQHFGAYEDAQSRRHPVLFHSLLSPLLNIGLLTPQQVLDETIEAAIQYEIPLNSLEGFVRQLVGWREYIRLVYALDGRRQRSRNFWNFSRKIPAAFWTGNTGIHPIDEVVQKINRSGYAHHIERLMVLGNFFLLCAFDPDEVYRWFMELFVDSYDWVMVPNVYAMTQFADGGRIMTKPYISGSNYLLKMGDWQKGPWQQTWDGLFWHFMHEHRSFMLQNPRLAMLVRSFDKMPDAKRQAHIQAANRFLQQLDEGQLQSNTLF